MVSQVSGEAEEPQHAQCGEESSKDELMYRIMGKKGQECLSKVANKMTSNRLQQGKSQLNIKNKLLLVSVIN